MTDWIRRFAHRSLPPDVSEHLQQFESVDDAFARSDDGACLLWCAATGAMTDAQKLAVRVAAAQVEAAVDATLINRPEVDPPSDPAGEAHRAHLAACRAAAFEANDKWIPADFVPESYANNPGAQKKYRAAGAATRKAAAEALRRHALLANLREEGLRG
ncbi:hypothetical protein [Sorangium sp. So ce233]|uniref:hypothetical protein n=1 Tax=Sorangium sp. So ce233 TaxID=3133290 RepID=UPI003F6346B3